jgi:hypothetical protein
MTQESVGASDVPGVFDQPFGMAVIGSHLWVANGGGNSVTEINTLDGSVVRIVRSSADHLEEPTDIASSGADLWVLNEGNKSITELSASNGSLVRVLSSGKYHFNFPQFIAYGDSHIWVANEGNAKSDTGIVEINPTNGSLIRVIRSKDLYSPVAITTNHQDLWVTNGDTKPVVEFNASTGSLVRVIDAPADRFNNPLGIEATAGDVWVSNSEGPSAMTEINASTGSLVRVVPATGSWSANPRGFSTGPSPATVAVGQGHVWIANTANVVEINANNGSLIRVVSADADDFNYTRFLVVDGSHVWTSNSLNNSVTELDASNGTLVRVVR